MINTLTLVGSPMLPLASTARTLRVCAPLANAVVGAKLHAPVPSAVVVPSNCVSWYTLTMALAVAVPLSSGVVSAVAAPGVTKTSPEVLLNTLMLLTVGSTTLETTVVLICKLSIQPALPLLCESP